MRAAYYAVFGGPENLQIGERPDPVPDSGQMLVRTCAAGVGIWARASGTMLIGVAETTARTVRPRENRRIPRSVSIVGPKLNRRAPSVNKCRPYAPAISAHARSVSATLQACAMHPPGRNGGSASNTSAMLPTP